MSVNRAFFILSAGYGTRLKPFTNFLPKPLFTVKDQPLIGRHLKNITSNSCEPIYMNIAYHPNALISYIDSVDLGVRYIYEIEPCGVAGALKLFCDMAPEVDQVFFMSCDLYLSSYEEVFFYWDCCKPHVFVDEKDDYAGLSILNTQDIKRRHFDEFKYFFKFMKKNYSSSILKDPIYNVGSLSQVPL